MFTIVRGSKCVDAPRREAAHLYERPGHRRTVSRALAFNPELVAITGIAPARWPSIANAARPAPSVCALWPPTEISAPGTGRPATVTDKRSVVLRPAGTLLGVTVTARSDPHGAASALAPRLDGGPGRG